MSANPYESPIATPHVDRPELWLLRSAIYVVGMTALAGVIGCLIGAAIGTFAPEYYEFAYPSRREFGFRPMNVGAVLGLLQGGGVGMGLGVMLVAIHSWYSLRLARLRLQLKSI